MYNSFSAQGCVTQMKAFSAQGCVTQM